MKTELVTSLKRRATEIVSELQEARAPVLITQHGRPAAYLIDVESVEAMERRVAVLEGIARGERALGWGWHTRGPRKPSVRGRHSRTAAGGTSV